MSSRDDGGTVAREGRFSRWSRLKRQGGGEGDGDGPPAPAPATDPAASDGDDGGFAVPDPHAMPGGAAARRGSLVPAMSSLVGDDDGPAPDMDDGAIVSDDEMAALSPEEAAIVGELPPFESLTKESDFTPFLADKVPAFIRRRALSILWRSDPVLANLDGLNDYDENYRIIDKLISAAEDTIYRVGKGHRKNDDPPEEDETGDDEIAAEPPAGDDTGDDTEIAVSSDAVDAEQPAEGGPPDNGDAEGPVEKPRPGSVRKPG